MTIATLLAVLTLAVVLVITLALALYLFSITLALRDATKYLDQLMDGLAKIERETGSLDKNMTAIKGGHAQLLSTLQTVDERLTQMSKRFVVEEHRPLESVPVRQRS
jgi:hypothetical protein